MNSMRDGKMSAFVVHLSAELNFNFRREIAKLYCEKSFRVIPVYHRDVLVL